MKFKNRSDYSREGFSLDEFPFVLPEYGYIEAKGRMVVGKTGETNRYDQIQQAIPETSLTSIIQRLMKGDKSAVGDVVGSFVDATCLPKNLMEAQNLMIFSERYFETLPVDVRKKYSNDIGAFLKDVDAARSSKDLSIKEKEPENIDDGGDK